MNHYMYDIVLDDVLVPYMFIICMISFNMIFKCPLTHMIIICMILFYMIF